MVPGHSRPVGSGLRARAAIGSRPGWAGRGGPAYKGAAARRGAVSSVCVGVLCVVSRFLCGLRSGPERVPASHGDEGSVRAEGRRPGAGYHPLRAKGKDRRGETGGEAVPAHLCPGAAGGPSGRPRHAPGAWVGGSAGRRTPGPRPCGARPRSAESPGEPAAVVRGEAWAGVQGGNTRRPCGCRPPRVSEGGEEAWEESRLPRRLLGVRRPGRRPEVLEDAVALLAGSVFGS